MLIPDLTLTPGLADRLRKCGDEPLRAAHVMYWPDTLRAKPPGFIPEIAVFRANGDELAEHEQRRVEGVITAHRVKAF